MRGGVPFLRPTLSKKKKEKGTAKGGMEPRSNVPAMTADTVAVPLRTLQAELASGGVVQTLF